MMASLASHEIPLFVISHKEASGFIVEKLGKWYLLKGSTTVVGTTNSMPQSAYDHRERCLMDRSLVEGKNPRLFRVARDIEFGSKSAVAYFFKATSESGPRSLVPLSRSVLAELLSNCG